MTKHPRLLKTDKILEIYEMKINVNINYIYIIIFFNCYMLVASLFVLNMYFHLQIYYF